MEAANTTKRPSDPAQLTQFLLNSGWHGQWKMLVTGRVKSVVLGECLSQLVPFLGSKVHGFLGEHSLRKSLSPFEVQPNAAMLLQHVNASNMTQTGF